MLIRFGVLAPLSLLFPRLRDDWSSPDIPGCRSTRRSAASPAEGELARQWRWQEAAASVWAIALLAMVATGVIPLRAFLIFLGVAVRRDVPQPGADAGRAFVGE